MTYRLALCACSLFIAGCSLTGGGGGSSSSSSSVTETSSSLPDLAIDYVTVDRVINGNIEARVHVKNPSLFNCPAGFTVSLSNNSGINRTERFDMVILSQRNQISHTFVLPVASGATSDVLTARVDILGEVAESNEQNNETIKHYAFRVIPTAIN